MILRTAKLRSLFSFITLLTCLGFGSTALDAQNQLETSTESIDARLFYGLNYRCVGPTRGGRVTTVTGIAQRPGHFFLGATGGGVYKTTNYGQSWKNVSDGYLTTPSIGAIRVAPSNPDIVYVGTGSDAIRSNVITGRGAWKSTDAGKTWKFIGLASVGQIGAVEIHPSNPDIVYVAAIGQAFQANPERGVYRSKDGGQTWQKVLFISDQIGIVDLELHPADPDTLYACSWRAERKPWTIISGAEGCGLYKSVDGGNKWDKLGGGLPDGVVGKSDLAVSRAEPNRLYALIEAEPGKGGVYRSDDSGKTFKLISTQAGLRDRPFYYCNIDADPSNADVLYVNSTRFYRSQNAGKTWRSMSTPHGDNHDIWIHPDNSLLMVQANDGGANVSIDGGQNWSTQSNQATAELYQVNIDDRFPYWLYAGQQDNSTIRVPSNPPYPSPAGPQGYWQSIGGCETGPAIPKPGDSDIVYAACKGRFGRFNFRTGQEKQFYVGAANMYGHNPKNLRYRFQRVAPIALSPHDPNTVYHASQFLHRSKNEGQTWETISPDLTAFEAKTQVISGAPLTRDITGEEFYSTIYTIAESPLTPGLIWVGANDGPVHVTRDHGKTWLNVTPGTLPKGGRVQTVEPSPHRPGKCFVSVLRYQLGDWRPHIYRTEDYGKTWANLSLPASGLPQDTPSRVVREDPAREGLLYAGMEFGMFVSFDNGKKWRSLQRNLPITPITDIKVHAGDLVLSTMGRSFWILDDLSPLHQFGLSKIQDTLHVFQPRKAYRVRSSRGGGSDGVQYLSTGGFIDYHLSEDVDELTFEVLNSKGAVIRQVESRRGRSSPRPRDTGSGMRPSPRIRRSELGRTAGAHRFRWDLRHGGASLATPRGGGGALVKNVDTGKMERRRPSGRGPMVAPGRYKVRISTGTTERSVPIEVLVDPRVADDGITQTDIEAQVDLCLQVGQLSARASALASKLGRAQADKKHQDKVEGLQSLRAELLTSTEGRYQRPMLRDQIRYLSRMIDRADQRPGKDAVERSTELNAWLTRLESTFREMTRR